MWFMGVRMESYGPGKNSCRTYNNHRKKQERYPLPAYDLLHMGGGLQV